MVSSPHGSFNEESLRYCIALRDYYVPEGLEGALLEAWKTHNEAAFDFYEELVGQQKIVKEQARSVLPIGIYTNFFWTVNGSSLMNFLKLRLDRQAPSMKLGFTPKLFWNWLKR